jgi:hypothetical protein
MARIRVARRICGKASHRHSQWFDLVDAGVLHRQIDVLLGPDGGANRRDWEVLAYDGLPDFGPQPDLTELLVWLDAVDELGALFEAWWMTQPFGSVMEAADAFADAIRALTPTRRVGRCTRSACWVSGSAPTEAVVASGDVQIIAAVGGASMCSGTPERS